MPHSPHTYLVTGANRGLGLEFAVQLSARGDVVIATARDPDKADDLKKTGARVLPLDVADDASIASLREALKGERIDIVINNAGVSSDSKSIETLKAEELMRTIRINSVGPVMVTQAALPALRAGVRKTVVNITSQLGSIANNKGGSSYGYRASKACLNMLTVCLANELKGEDFTCIAIHPGWVQTDMGGKAAPITPEQSIRTMLKTIDGLKPEDTGRYLNTDGATIPW